jgi:hypothetical protein
LSASIPSSQEPTKGMKYITRHMIEPFQIVESPIAIRSALSNYKRLLMPFRAQILIVLFHYDNDIDGLPSCCQITLHWVSWENSFHRCIQTSGWSRTEDNCVRKGSNTNDASFSNCARTTETFSYT